MWVDDGERSFNPRELKQTGESKTDVEWKKDGGSRWAKGIDPEPAEVKVMWNNFDKILFKIRLEFLSWALLMILIHYFLYNNYQTLS